MADRTCLAVNESSFVSRLVVAGDVLWSVVILLKGVNASVIRYNAVNVESRLKRNTEGFLFIYLVSLLMKLIVSLMIVAELMCYILPYFVKKELSRAQQHFCTFQSKLK